MAPFQGTAVRTSTFRFASMDIVSASWGSLEITELMKEKFWTYIRNNRSTNSWRFKADNFYFGIDPNVEDVKALTMVWRFVEQRGGEILYSRFFSNAQLQDSIFEIWHDESEEIETFEIHSSYQLDVFIVAAYWHITSVTSQVTEQFENMVNDGSPRVFNIGRTSFRRSSPYPGAKQCSVTFGRRMHSSWIYSLVIGFSSQDDWSMSMPEAVPAIGDRWAHIYAATWGTIDYTSFVKNMYIDDRLRYPIHPHSRQNSWSVTPTPQTWGLDSCIAPEDTVLVVIYRVAVCVGHQTKYVFPPGGSAYMSRHYPVLQDVSGIRCAMVSAGNTLTIGLDGPSSRIKFLDLDNIHPPISWSVQYPWVACAVFGAKNITPWACERINAQAREKGRPRTYTLDLTEISRSKAAVTPRQLTVMIGFRVYGGYTMRTVTYFVDDVSASIHLPGTPEEALGTMSIPWASSISFMNHGTEPAWPIIHAVVDDQQLPVISGRPKGLKVNPNDVDHCFAPPLHTGLQMIKPSKPADLQKFQLSNSYFHVTEQRIVINLTKDARFVPGAQYLASFDRWLSEDESPRTRFILTPMPSGYPNSLIVTNGVWCESSSVVVGSNGPVKEEEFEFIGGSIVAPDPCRYQLF